MFRFDPHGLHIAELARLAMIHPLLFAVTHWLINHNLNTAALWIAAKFSK